MPTRIVLTNPDETSTSTSIGTASMPTRANELSLASMQAAPGICRSDKRPASHRCRMLTEGKCIHKRLLHNVEESERPTTDSQAPAAKCNSHPLLTHYCHCPGGPCRLHDLE